MAMAYGRYGTQPFSFEAVVYDGAEYCEGCLPEGVDVNSEDVSPIFADAEVDRPVVCCECFAVHDYMNVMKQDDKPTEEPIPTAEEDLDAALAYLDAGNANATVSLAAVMQVLEARYGESALVRAVATHFDRTPELLVRGLREAGMEVH